MEEIKIRINYLISGLGIALSVFTITRFIFFLYNFHHTSLPKNDIFHAFMVGIWFDAVPVFYYHLLFIILLIVPHRGLSNKFFISFLKASFLIPNIVASCQNLVDTAYFPYNKKRTGAEIFHLAKEWNVNQLETYFMDFWKLTILWILIVICLFWFANKCFKLTYIKKSTLDIKRQVFHWAAFMVVWVTITIITLRGGLGLIPLRTFDAGRYVTSELVPLAINTPFQLICTIEGKDAPEFHFLNDKEASHNIQEVKSYQHKNGFKQKNIVLIIVESLGKEYIGFYNNGKGYTPFLDSLCKKALTFENAYANGTTSMDAPPALFSGIAHLMEDSYIVSQFNTNTPASIGSLLGAKGYDCSFYHGGKNGTMGFDNFISLSRMGDYFGLSEYPKEQDYDGKWGIFDEPYLQYYAQQLNNKRQPFFSTVFTLSSHHPYTIPPHYSTTFPKGTLPIHQSIGYTDLALKKFFSTVKQMPWFSNTIFILTADHTADSDNPAYQHMLGKYAIPLIIYSPETPNASTSYNIFQHSLLLPTLLDYLHYDKPFISLGNSALRENSFAIFYTNANYLLVESNWVVVMRPDKKVNLYAKMDLGFQNDLSSENPQVRERLELKLKCYLQIHFQRLRSNAFKIQ